MLDPGEFDPVLSEALLEFGNMGSVPGFDGAEDMDPREIGAGKGPVVDDLGHIRALKLGSGEAPSANYRFGTGRFGLTV